MAAAAVLPALASDAIASPEPRRKLVEGIAYRFRPDRPEGMLHDGSPELDGGAPHWFLPIFDAREFDDPNAKPIDIAYFGTPTQFDAAYPCVQLRPDSTGVCRIEHGKLALISVRSVVRDSSGALEMEWQRRPGQYRFAYRQTFID